MDKLFNALERANRNKVYRAVYDNKREMAVLRSIKNRYEGHGKAYEFVLRKARELKIGLTKIEMVHLASQLWLESWRRI